MRRLPVATATLLCAASVVAACSSSGTKTTDHPAGSTAAHARPAASGGSFSGDTVPGAGSAGGTGSASGTGSEAGAGNAGAFCALITKDNVIMRDISAGDSNAKGVDTTKLLHDLDAALAVAPGEIKADMRMVVAFDRQILTQHKELKDTPKLDAALRHYGTWVQSHCHG